MNETQSHSEEPKVSLCEAVGAERGDFARFIEARDEALASRQEKQDKRIKNALQEEMAWAE